MKYVDMSELFETPMHRFFKTCYGLVPEKFPFWDDAGGSLLGLPLYCTPVIENGYKPGDS
jgi:hypothetical protein